jgi:hypothetical protein
MVKGPSEEFDDFDEINNQAENNIDEEFLESSSFDNALEESLDEPIVESLENDVLNEGENKVEKVSFIKKNKGLLIFMGIGATVVFTAMITLVPSNPTQDKLKRIQPSFERTIESQSKSTPNATERTGTYSGSIQQESLKPMPEAQPAQTTIVKGLSEEDVLNLVEPMGMQINSLIETVSDQNEFIQSLPREVSSVSNLLSKDNLSVIKGAIDAGLKRTEVSFNTEVAFLLEQIKTLSNRVNKLEKKDSPSTRRSMTMVTSISGKVQVQIDGTEETQEITNGTYLRGYGKVQRVGPWGCLHFFDGSTYEPARASCSEE